MPAPIRTPLTSFYHDLRSASDAKGETNDCAVVAIAAATGVTYDEAHQALASQGRRERAGTHVIAIRRAINALGFGFEVVDGREFIDQYPGAHKNAKGVTSHHPQRYNKVWKDGHSYVLITTNHAFAVVDGENHDWTRGRSLRVTHIYRIVKKEV